MDLAAQIFIGMSIIMSHPWSNPGMLWALSQLDYRVSAWCHIAITVHKYPQILNKKHLKIHTEGHNNKMVVISVIDQIKVKTNGAHCKQTQKGEEYHL